MDRRIQKTKASIREAYFKLLEQKKNGKITISEIAKEADIDRKTFYLHYDSIDGILDDFCNSRIDILKSQLIEKKFFENPLHIDLIFDIITQMLKENMGFYRVLASNSRSILFWMQIQQIMTEALVHYYKDKVSISEAELRIYVDFYIIGTIQIYQKWLIHPDTVPLDKLSDIVVDIARNGVMHLIPDQAEEA